ncbi:hypothetical protein [Shewanella sp. CG12_big_fil_rev_8_21_14_0_65_47_15]|uniref:hypothetical protein n=1 Tax=Shewanella sp. CG12_big_fil_rev_8_21_14_0_65_47_15 TaxID=1975537 RepID=UPI000CBE2654|nr:hypothetical protein [Shewanella sp. CG12_big_fil_rev_8_21_14_0_65_47_15]PIW61508.1 MAG: hypothetical protein COW15_08090 [Shewanella sp. CG12_big_fil_rev_8_21_14_0_65_47_15]
MKLIKLAVLLGLAFFAYQKWYAAKPLESHFLSSIPVKIQMLANPNAKFESSGQVNIESITTQKHPKEPLVLSVVTFSSQFDTIDEEDITELSFDDANTLAQKFKGLEGVEQLQLTRGYIEHGGQRGYEISMNMGKEGTLVQHAYAYNNHLLILTASYNDDGQNRRTAEAFLNSVEFL